MANGRKRKNTSQSLDNNGVLIEGTKDLLQHAIECYKKLFCPAPANLFHLAHDLWTQDEKLNEYDNDDLTRPFLVIKLKLSFPYGG
jgi:hypothetical protein